MVDILYAPTIKVMLYRIFADIVFLIHFAFIAFVVLGGFLNRWMPKIARVHLPAVAYGIAISVVGWTCPLTPLEWSLRSKATGQGFEGGWIEHYIVPLIYPAGLTPPVQLILAAILIMLTFWAYLPHLRDLRTGRP